MATVEVCTSYKDTAWRRTQTGYDVIDHVTTGALIRRSSDGVVVGVSVSASVARPVQTAADRQPAKIHDDASSTAVKVLLPCDALRCTVFVIVILSVRLSVCPSVCHTRALCPHGSTYDHNFFTVW